MLYRSTLNSLVRLHTVLRYHHAEEPVASEDNEALVELPEGPYYIGGLEIGQEPFPCLRLWDAVSCGLKRIALEHLWGFYLCRELVDGPLFQQFLTAISGGYNVRDSHVALPHGQ